MTIIAIIVEVVESRTFHIVTCHFVISHIHYSSTSTGEIGHMVDVICPLCLSKILTTRFGKRMSCVFQLDFRAICSINIDSGL